VLQRVLPVDHLAVLANALLHHILAETSDLLPLLLHPNLEVALYLVWRARVQPYLLLLADDVTPLGPVAQRAVKLHQHRIALEGAYDGVLGARHPRAHQVVVARHAVALLLYHGKRRNRHYLFCFFEYLLSGGAAASIFFYGV